MLSRFPAAFRRAGIGLLDRPAPAGELGLPCGRLTGLARTPTGLSRSARPRSGRGGCSLNPGATVFLRPAPSHQPPSPLPSGQPCPQRRIPSPGVSMTRQQREFACAHPSGLPLACGSRMERAPLGVFPDASNLAVTSNARQGGDGPANTCPELRCHHRRPSNQRAHSCRATSCRSQEVQALGEVHDPGLGLVERKAPRRQPRGQPRLDLLGLLPGLAAGDQESRRTWSPPGCRVRHRRRGHRLDSAPRRPPPTHAGRCSGSAD